MSLLVSSCITSNSKETETRCHSNRHAKTVFDNTDLDEDDHDNDMMFYIPSNIM